MEVGVGSCAVVSVTSEDTFPEDQFLVQLTSQMGDGYGAANGSVIHNTGQQTINAFTNEYISIQSKFQRTQVHRCLAAVSELEDNNNNCSF